MSDRRPLVEVAGVTRQLSPGDTLIVPKDFAFGASVTGTSPLAIGAVYLTSNWVLSVNSRALIGTAAGGTATLQLRRQGTGILLSGASWAVTGGLADISLGGTVTVAATDWYTIELLGGAGPTVALAYGLSLVP